MIRLDLLCCPRCGAELVAGGPDEVACAGCHHEYPVAAGIPVLLRDTSQATVSHQAELPPRPFYSMWKERLVLKALTDAQVALDFGAGRQEFDDPCIIKLDIIHDPILDVVGDLHELPIRSESLDFAFGSAVMEHIRDPRRAISEIYRVLRPGGFVYADWSFLTAYHGYPHHYSNVTIQGIQEAFRDFTCLEVGVGPHLAPGFTLRSVLGTYREHFAPQTRLEREFADLIQQILWHPLDAHDRRIPAGDHFRVAAGVYFFGVKQPVGGESVLPPPVLAAHANRPELQARYPQPLKVCEPDNLMAWARSAGRRESPDVDAFFRDVVPFSKDGVIRERVVAEWPDALITEVAHDPQNEAARNAALWFSRRFSSRLLDSWEGAGLYGVGHCFYKSLLRTWQVWRLTHRRH
jgi:SAM-dependent methyltransferase/uncharacterized protein YbaR (Trm112 family)